MQEMGALWTVWTLLGCCGWWYFLGSPSQLYERVYYILGPVDMHIEIGVSDLKTGSWFSAWMDAEVY